MTAAYVFSDGVLRFGEHHEIPFRRVLAGCGIKHCGNTEHHHTRTNLGRPRTRGVPFS